jgi:hypothetical protein
MNFRDGFTQSRSRRESALSCASFSGILSEPVRAGDFEMKRLIKPASFLAIVALCLFENVLHRQSSLYQEFEIALLQTQWMLLACLVVWCSTFIYLTSSLSGLPLIVLLIIAIVAFFINPPQNRPATDAFALLLGVTLGRAMRALLNQEGRKQKIGKPNADSGNILVGLVLLFAFASFWHLDITNNIYRRLRWMGLWDNPNIYGMLMGAGIVLTAGLFLADRRWKMEDGENERQKAESKKRKLLRSLRFFAAIKSTIRNPQSALLLVAAGMMGVGLLFSYSRGAWLGTAIGLLYLASAYGKFKWRFVLPGIFVVSAVVIFFWHGTADTDAWYLKRMDLSRASAQHRVAAWSGAIQMMRDHPFGVGWNKAVETYQKDYSPPEGSAAAITTNDYLMLGTQLGLPGLLCFVAYVGLSLKGESRKQKAEIPSPATRHSSLRAACRAGALALAVAFWFDGGLFKLATASVFWVLLELGNSNAKGRMKNAETDQSFVTSAATKMGEKGIAEN